MAEHGKQKQATQNEQVGDLRHLHAKRCDGITVRTNGVINDPLGQFQRQKQQRKQRQGDQQQQQLVAFGVLPDKGEKRVFYFAIPSNQVRPIIDQTVQNQRRGSQFVVVGLSADF